MITIETYLKFWGQDLMNIQIATEIEEVLPPAAVTFFRQYGLPTNDRIFRERKKYLESTTSIPEVILSEKNIKKSIKSLYPYFEFLPSLSETFEFQGEKFVKIGIAGEDDLAIDIGSGSVHRIDRNPPNSWPTNFPPLVQNQFINSAVDKFGLFLAAEFIARQECIVPTRKYDDAINSKNTKLRKVAEKEIDRIIDNLEKEFTETDSQALVTYECFWWSYLREYRDK